MYIQARNQLFIGVVPTLFLPFPFPPFLSSLFPFPSLPLLPSFPSRPFHAPTPKIQLGVLGERCMLPPVSPCRGRPPNAFWTFGAIEGQNFANHVSKFACSQHMPINIMFRCAVGGGGPGTSWTPFGYTGLLLQHIT